MAEKENTNYEMMQTKVSQYAYRRLKAIERKRGLSSYGIIQMMCDCVIRYMDDRHNLTPEMEQAMSIFEHMDGWKDALNLADPSAPKTVGEATYYLYDSTGKRKGVRAVHVRKPFFNDWSQDVNIQHIIERTFCLLLPERYRRLRGLAAEMGCSTLLELFDKLIDHFSSEADLAAMREMFEDADRAENNKPLAYGERTKRKRTAAIDEGEQQTIRFAPGDVPDMPDIPKDDDGLGFEPHGW